MIDHTGSDAERRDEGVAERRDEGVAERRDEGVDERVVAGVPVPALLVGADGRVTRQNRALDDLLGGSLVGRRFDGLFVASTDVDGCHRAPSTDGGIVDVELSMCDPAPSGSGYIVFALPVTGERPRSTTARWLHDQVVPLVMTAGLRIDLASLDARDDQAEHLTAASAALTELGATIRAEMDRVVSE